MLNNNIICSDIKIVKWIINNKSRLLNIIKYSINYEMLKYVQQHTILVTSRCQITSCFYFIPWDFFFFNSEFYFFVIQFEKPFTENNKRK